MSQVNATSYKDASGGSNAVLYGVAAPANSMGFRNRIINGNMAIAQRATSATVTAGTAVPTASTGYPAVDRFFVYSTGANVTAARVAGSGSTQYRMQITGAASVTNIGVAQRIEQLNSYDLAGGNAILSVDLANSVLTTVTWTASYANTVDTFGTVGTPTKTQIATGTFTVNSTVTNYTAQIAVPAAATTGIEIFLSVGAQTSGTWTIGNMQLEAGSVASPFERVNFTTSLSMCQRYCQTIAPNFNVGYTVSNTVLQSGGPYVFPTVMRAAPTLTGGAYTVNTGSAGTVAIWYSSTNSVNLLNSSANWTVGANAFVSSAAILSSEL